MNQKLLIVFIILSVIISLTACGKSENETILPSDDMSGTSEAISSSSTSDIIASEPESKIHAPEKSSTKSQAMDTATTGNSRSNSTAGNSNKTQSNNSTTTNPPAISQPQTSTPPPYAKASDTELIADKIIEYINQFRAEQGVSAATKLPGLTKVAQYRSKQLVTNFAHDIDDIRAAAAALKYGEHIVYDDGAGFKLDYYTANAREAIGYYTAAGSINECAYNQANNFKNSSGHWSYVGGAEYKYIAVGVTYSNGLFYCCILMSQEGLYG